MPPEKVYPSVGVVDEYMKYCGGASIRNLIAFVALILSIRKRRFDVLAYLVPSTRTPEQRRRDAFFFRLTGIRRVVGMEGFPVDPFPRDARGSLMTVESESDALLRRLSFDGIAAPGDKLLSMDLGITDEEREDVTAWWSRNVLGAEMRDNWFALCPGSKWASKRWPFDRYLEVARRLWTEQQLFPIVVGGPEDRALGERLIEYCGAGACAAGKLSVRQSAALVERAVFYLGNDSGPMHLAAAAGTPCVAIFSSQDWPGRWYPYGQGHEILRFNVPCAGCFSPTCYRQLECLTNIEPNEVYAACLKVMSHCRRGNFATSCASIT